MLLKIKRTFATPGRAFHAGQVHEVADDEAPRMIELGLAEKADPAPVAEGDVIKAASAATARAAASRRAK